MKTMTFIFVLFAVSFFFPIKAGHAAQLYAGVAKADITDYTAGPVNDPLYVKALVLKNSSNTVVLITVDAVAIGKLGRISNDFLPNIRAQLQKDLNIPPSHVLVNASHCHGVVRTDTARLAVQTVEAACSNWVPVTVGTGIGRETRIMENRRLKLKNGEEADVRRAYALPPDEEVVASGPVDPDIGVLRIDKRDGKPLAVVYNFACHPIMGVPSGGNTADYPGFASSVIEETIGDGAVALFLQGCAGDINPALYKTDHQLHDAESLGNLLGLSTMRAMKKIETQDDGELKVINEVIALPRGTDLAQRISRLEKAQARLVQSLKGTSLNLKAFIPLYVQYALSSNYPSYYSYRYLQNQSPGRDELTKLDTKNRANMESYIQNVHVMERLTRIQENLRLLKMHHAQNMASGQKTVDAEIVVLKIGDFVLATFPGEPSAEIGLNIKRHSPYPFTFVSGCCNGYLYYAPTAQQRNNPGFAQEDCDCLLAPEWQKAYEEKVALLLEKLSHKN
ncbi:MAG: hypothetical protein WC340_02390 [Kiritimatiellia bacterium]